VKARSLLDKALALQLTAATRQSLLFAKAKILFIQKQYAAALQIFQQLGRTRLRSTAGGSTKTEIRYYEALTNSKLGRASAANLIWRQLADDRFTYYGQKSAVRLGRTSTVTETASRVCDISEDATRNRAEQAMDALRRPIRTEALPATDALPELLFLRLWDEASIWMDRQARPNPRTAAELAYLSGRYYRAISYAGRMPQNDAYTIELKYPAGFRTLICKNAATYSVDPLWLHSIIWQESKYNPLARSDASARGLMQFIPDTAADVASAIGKSDFSLESLYDPSVNIELGAHYWSTLMNEFKEPELALAAYNGGPDNVRRWKGKWKDGDAEFFVSDIGFVETKTYVMAVFGARAAYGSR
jgi:soluble lytic murein transglycosylase